MSTVDFSRPGPGGTKKRPHGASGWYGTSQGGITLLFTRGEDEEQARAFAATAADTHGEALEWVSDNLTNEDAGGVFLALEMMVGSRGE